MTSHEKEFARYALNAALEGELQREIMKAKIEFVHIVQTAGVSRKTGNAYDIRTAQCVIRDVDPQSGDVKPKIGTLQLPARFKDIPKGVYMVEFDPAVTTGEKGGRVVSEVGDVKPWDAVAAAAPVRTVTVEVLSVTPRAGFSKKSLKDYDMLFADCLVHKVDRVSGELVLLVGELLVPDRFKDITPGLYDVEFEIAVGQDKRIGGRVFEMTPKKSASVAPAASVSSMPLQVQGSKPSAATKPVEAAPNAVAEKA